MAGAKVTRVFLDASVLVAASASITGASAYVLHLSRQGKIKALISEDSIGEAVKNVGLKLGRTGKKRLGVYLGRAKPVSVENPSPELVAVCEQIIEPKDASILAAAILGEAEVLLTLDRKHFFTKKVVESVKPMKIMTPGEFLRQYKARF